MTAFTPIASLVGGMLIGLAAVLMMLVAGRIAGVSGIAAGALPPFREGLAGRVAFIAGLIVAPLLHAAVMGEALAVTIAAPPLTLAIAGLLVGFGSVWGSGCTSGHGVCGLARLSRRSLVAVAVFMTAAIVTVFLMRHGGGR
jgi:uncharacterized protein